jgi:hypothetical protein
VKPSIERDDRGRATTGLTGKWVCKANVAIVESAVFKEVFDTAWEILFVLVKLEDWGVFLHNVKGNLHEVQMMKWRESLFDGHLHRKPDPESIPWRHT